MTSDTDRSDDDVIRQQAIFLAHHARSVSEKTLKHLLSEDGEHSDAALLAGGSVLSKIPGDLFRDSFHKIVNARRGEIFFRKYKRK